MSLKLYNTMGHKMEEFKPITEGKCGFYGCGPTVYNHAHIGNTRPMIVFDVLRRTFEYLGNDVTFVSNYTDVDDKIIKAAKAEGITEKELTDKYIKAYEDVRAGLNIEDPTKPINVRLHFNTYNAQGGTFYVDPKMQLKPLE